VAIDEFVTACAGKNSAPGKSSNWHTGFSAARSLSARIRKGHLTLPLQQLKDLPDDPDGCSEFERLFLADLEQPRSLGPPDDQEPGSTALQRPFRAQAICCAPAC